MRRSPALLLAVLTLTSLPFGAATAGCGSGSSTETCDEATAKLAKCGIKGGAPSGMQPVCTGIQLCNANCINAASCGALVDAFAESPGAPSQAFVACTSKCMTAP